MKILALIMEYKELYALSCKFSEALKCYVIERGEVDDSYYVAKVFLSELSEKSYKNIELRNEFGKWLKHGSTVRLKNVLRHVKYNDSNLAHFNAMCLIDTVHACL
jgi:hypothetical protein